LQFHKIFFAALSGIFKNGVYFRPEILLQLFLRYTADVSVNRVEGYVVQVVQVGEHADAGELGYACQEDKAQVCVV